MSACPRCGAQPTGREWQVCVWFVTTFLFIGAAAWVAVSWSMPGMLPDMLQVQNDLRHLLRQ